MHTSTLLATRHPRVDVHAQHIAKSQHNEYVKNGAGWKAAPISSKTYPRCRRCRRAGCCTGSLHWSCRRPWCSSTCTCSARANAHLPGRGRPVAQAFPSARGARVPPVTPDLGGARRRARTEVGSVKVLTHVRRLLVVELRPRPLREAEAVRGRALRRRAHLRAEGRGLVVAARGGTHLRWVVAPHPCS